MNATPIRSKPGPKLRRGSWHWEQPCELDIALSKIAKQRDSADPEAEDAQAVMAAATRFLGREPTPLETATLQRLALSGKPSVISRVLMHWKFTLPFRVLRVMNQRKDIAEARWG